MGLPPREEGRHPGQWQDPPLLPFSLFFAKSDASIQVKSHAFEFSLRTWNFLSCPPCLSLFYPLLSSFIDEGHPQTPPRMQRNLTHSLYNGRYSFIIWTHFPDGAIEGSRLSCSLSFSLIYSSCHGVFTKVLSIVIATTIWTLERHKARGQSVNRYNISLDMQMSVAQLRATAHFDVNHRSESCLNACVLNRLHYDYRRELFCQ